MEGPQSIGGPKIVRADPKTGENTMDIPGSIGGPKITQSSFTFNASTKLGTEDITNPSSNAKTLKWVATIGYHSGATGWLQVSPLGGSLDAGKTQQITVSVIKNLAPGQIYTATVVFSWAPSNVPGDTLTITFSA